MSVDQAAHSKRVCLVLGQQAGRELPMAPNPPAGLLLTGQGGCSGPKEPSVLSSKGLCSLFPRHPAPQLPNRLPALEAVRKESTIS